MVLDEVRIFFDEVNRLEVDLVQQISYREVESSMTEFIDTLENDREMSKKE